jgi:alpha-methylacyl-CoA racemase
MQPLQSLRVVEFEGIGPGPLAGLMLAGLGAHVTVIVRPGGGSVQQALGGGSQPLRRGKQAMTLDLKQPAGVAQALALVDDADALIEGNRPGVMERLGLGPQVCLQRKPSLVYGRMTGWGQHGPLAQAAGHDLNYVALTGLLSLAARPGEAPIIPPTVVGDASGALGLAFGIVSGVLEARAGGRGCVVDAAIVDIVAMLGTLVHWVRAGGQIDSSRPSPFHDSPFYDTYACADGRFVTLGALEPQFYALLLRKLGLDDVDPAAQYDTAQWPALKQRIAALLKTRARDEWRVLLEGTDVCFAPVLSVAEAVEHPHLAARGVFTVSDEGQVSAQIAPRFSAVKLPLPRAGEGGG